MTSREGVTTRHAKSTIRTAESSVRTHLRNHVSTAVDLGDLGVQSRCCSTRANSVPCHHIAC